MEQCKHIHREHKSLNTWTISDVSDIPFWFGNHVMSLIFPVVALTHTTKISNVVTFPHFYLKCISSNRKKAQVRHVEPEWDKCSKIVTMHLSG